MNESFIVLINNFEINVNVIRKNIKNMYLRVKYDEEIYITCNILYTKKSILKFIKDNEKSIIKMLERQKRIKSKEDYFIYLGKKYEIVVCNEFKNIVFDDNKVFVKNKSILEKYLRENAKVIFLERLKFNFNRMFKKGNIPTLIIKKMKAKWGYYNKRDNIVCLNLNLISYDIDDIDYVIVHELCHIVHFNHSKDFWSLVEKYKRNYKINRKNLRE